MRAVVEALKPELVHPARQKARAAIIVRGNMLNLHFEAKDAATLRAIFSSYVRMLAATLNVCEIMHQLETPDAVNESDKG